MKKTKLIKVEIDWPDVGLVQELACGECFNLLLDGDEDICPSCGITINMDIIVQMTEKELIKKKCLEKTAKQTWDENISKIENLLCYIQNNVENIKDNTNKEINWGHVGDTNKTIKNLTEVSTDIFKMI